MEVTDGKGDLDKFNSDLASKEVSQKINFDMAIGNRIDVGGTPAFYIDGQLIDWGNKKGSSININGETISWDAATTGEQFKDLLIRIVKAKLKE